MEDIPGRELVDKVVIYPAVPDILVKGGDYSLEDIPGRELVNKVVIYPLIPDISTTKIINHGNHA